MLQKQGWKAHSSVYFSQAARAKLERLARASGLSRSKVINRLILAADEKALLPESEVKGENGKG